MQGTMRIQEWQELPAEARPKARFWVPGAAMEEEDLRAELREGENTLEVRVVSNLYNRLPPTGGSMQFPFPVHFIPNDYGIFETDGKRCVLRVL